MQHVRETLDGATIDVFGPANSMRWVPPERRVQRPEVDEVEKPAETVGVE